MLERVLQDLANHLLPSAVEEILVVENGSRDETESVCKRYDTEIPLRYHFVEEPGKSHALNAALELTRATLLVLLDDDVRLEPGTVGAFVDGASRFGPGHFFGGPLVPEYEEGPPPAWLAPWHTTCVVGWDLGAQEQPHDEFIGTNWAAFREDLLQAGGFVRGLGPNADFRTVGQEVEMQKRLVDRGCKGIYLPGAGIQHHVRANQCTLAWLRQRWRQQSSSQVLLSPEHLEVPQIGGVPRFLWRQYVTELVKATAARMTGPHTERRMRAELRLAWTAGKVRGYRRLARAGAFVVPQGQAGDAVL